MSDFIIGLIAVGLIFVAIHALGLADLSPLGEMLAHGLNVLVELAIQ